MATPLDVAPLVAEVDADALADPDGPLELLQPAAMNAAAANASGSAIFLALFILVLSSRLSSR
jgi:hypothetical protein